MRLKDFLPVLLFIGEFILPFNVFTFQQTPCLHILKNVFEVDHISDLKCLHFLL